MLSFPHLEHLRNLSIVILYLNLVKVPLLEPSHPSPFRMKDRQVLLAKYIRYFTFVFFLGNQAFYILASHLY